MRTLAEEPSAHGSVIARVPLVLGVCAMCIVLALACRRQLRLKAPTTPTIEATVCKLRSRPLPLAVPHPVAESNCVQRCIASCLRCSCGTNADARKTAALHQKILPQSPTPSGGRTPLPPEAAARLPGELRLLECELFRLRLAEPELAQDIELISEDLDWLQCFWAACDRDAEATAALIRCYASSSRAFDLADAQAAEILDAGLVDILPGGDDDCPVVAVVRDIQTIRRLLQAHSFRDLVAAHLMQLQRLLKSSARARQHGVSMVHDLSGLSWALMQSMMDPRNLHAQLSGARFLFTAFPVRFHTIVVVDAPPAFGMLLSAAKVIAPGAIPAPLRFVSRPEADAHCELTFGQPVL